MKKFLQMFSLVGFVLAAFMVKPVVAAKPTDKGFNELGYNYNARLFSGLADGTDKILDGKVWGDTTYANDHLVMKWNEAWDLCNDAGNNDPTVCAGAWTSNQWNGATPGGSGEVWHYKIIWVGSDGEQSPYWVDDGYLIWNNYEVIMDHGTSEGIHEWLTHGSPSGYGAAK